MNRRMLDRRRRHRRAVIGPGAPGAGTAAAAAAASGGRPRARLRAAAARRTHACPTGSRSSSRASPPCPKVSVALTFRSGLAADPAEKAGLAQFVADAAQEGTATRDSRRLRDEVFAMGATLGATVGQDATYVHDARPGRDAAADARRCSPTSSAARPFPRPKSQLLKANAAQRAPGAAGVAAFVSNRAVPQRALRRAPLRADRRHARHRSRRSIARRLSPTTRRTTCPTTRSSSSPATSPPTRCSPAVEKAFGDWARGTVVAAGVPGAAGAQGPQARLRAAARQRAVVDLGRQRHPQARRPALVHAAAGQPDLRRRVRLAAGAQHPRGEGLHLLAAVAVRRLRRHRRLPRRRRRAQRRHRRDAEGDLRRDGRAARRRRPAGPSSTAPRPTRAACS